MSTWIFRSVPICAAMIVIAAALSPAMAAPPAGSTQAVVTEMCGGCVKGITAKLREIPEVDSIECEVKTKTVTIVPKGKATLSPKLLWETLEAAGKTPVKLVTPQGTFTSKPKA